MSVTSLHRPEKTVSINLLILAARTLPDNSREIQYPACLQEVDGRPALEHILYNTRNIKDGCYSFAISEYHIDRFHLDNIARVLTPDAHIVAIPQNTMGSACTALFVACTLNQDLPILIISSNEIVKMDLREVVERFVKKGYDGGLLTFHSVHPRYSYVRLNREQEVVEVAQQNPLSENATAGVFWYANTGTFVWAAKESIRKNSMTSNQYYIAPVFNQMILKKKKVGIFPMDTKDYFPLKEDIQFAGRTQWAGEKLPKEMEQPVDT